MFKLKFFLIFFVFIFSCTKKPLRTTKTYKLDNGLSVYLVSDARAQKSAVSLNVAVGSFNDTKEGFTHFLEHMLFLGTNKYSDPGAFNNFINSKQGYFNGYTSTENTNYYFDIDDTFFETALDMFSCFFYEPMFNPEFLEKEKNAVHSEFKLRMEDDRWREKRLENYTSNSEHSINRFSIGNIDTLKDINRDELLDFFNKYYVAQNMHLVIISKLDITTIESYVNNYFKNIKSGVANTTFIEKNLFNDLPHLIYIKPETNRSVLKIQFEVPSVFNYLDSKPDYILASLVGHEGEGSLLSVLKKEDLALELEAGVNNVSRNNSFFEVSIKLTSKGFNEYKQVIKYFFSYINMLKKEGLKKYYFNDLKKIAEINFKYKSLANFIDEAKWLSKHFYLFKNPDEIEHKMSLFYKYSEADFNIYLDSIVPEKQRILLINKDLEFDLIEPYMNVKYSKIKIEANDFISNLSNAYEENLKYPRKNIYIPNSFKIYNSKIKNPYKLLDNKQAIVWYYYDNEIKLPRTKMSYTIKLDEKYNSKKILKQLYVKALNESLREWAYEISEAGSSFLIKDVSEGIEISLFSYNQVIDLILNDLFLKLKNFYLDEKIFNSLKKELYIEYKNIEKKYPYEQALYISKVLLNKDELHYFDFIDDIEKIKFSDIIDFANTIYNEIYIKILVYGSLNPVSISKFIEKKYQILNSKPIDQEKLTKNNILKINDKDNKIFINNIDMQNNVFLRLYQINKLSVNTSATWRLIASLINSYFYNQLRTQEQFGYLVYADRYILDNILYYIMLIQSPYSNPNEMEKSINDWIKSVNTYFSFYKLEDFLQVKESIKSEFRKKEININEKFNFLETLVNIYDGDYLYKEKIIEEIDKLSIADLVADFAKYIEDKDFSTSVSIYLYNNKTNNFNEFINDIKKYKNNLILFSK